jgi:hypothetical protein
MNKKFFKKDIKGLYNTFEGIILNHVPSKAHQKDIILNIQDLFHKYYHDLSFKPILPSNKRTKKEYNKQELYSSFHKTIIAFGINPAGNLESFCFYKQLTDIVDRFFE